MTHKVSVCNDEIMVNGEYKNIMKRIVMMIMAVALIALPTMAQQEWQSTSSMAGSGSAYGAQVTAVGAVEVNDMATTTESYSPAQAPSGRRKVLPGGTTEPGQSSDSPIGDAVWPLMLLACAYLIWCAARKRARTMNR